MAEDTIEYWKEQAAIKENELIELQKELENTKLQNEEEKKSLENKIKSLEEEKKDTFPETEEPSEPKDSTEADKQGENGANQATDEMPKPEDVKVEDLIREKDLNNVDILLSTILKEMQDMKTKVSLIEKAVLLDSKVADSQKAQPSYYQAPRVTMYNGVQETQFNQADYPMTSNDRFREAFVEKSEELEIIQKELLQIKASQSKLALQKAKNDRMIANQRPLSKFEVSARKELQKVTSTPRYQSPPFKYAQSNRGKFSMKGETGKSPKGILKPPTRVSKFESKSSPTKPSFSAGVISEGYGSSEEELANYNGFVESGDEEGGYKGRVRPSDDFDWTKGVYLPSMAFSQETLDRGNKFVRKVQKKYDKDHPEYRRLDADEEDIERILKGSFHETDDGALVYTWDGQD